MAELIDGAEIVYHMAAAVGVRLIVESPVRTIETNIKLTELVLEAAAKKRKPVFVASTSECYGKAKRSPSARTRIWCLARRAKAAGRTLARS